jgi:hypothetical protein
MFISTQAPHNRKLARLGGNATTKMQPLSALARFFCQRVLWSGTPELKRAAAWRFNRESVDFAKIVWLFRPFISPVHRRVVV